MLRDNPRVHDTRQTENLRENWILRQRNRECNNSPFVISRWFSWGKTGNEKAFWCVQTALKQKKWWGIYNQIRTHSPFCKRLIINHSQVTHKLKMVIHSFSELHSPRQW
jgi:hypothetical protein